MVGTSRDTTLLLPDGGDLDDALAAGSLQRDKIRGRWLFFEPAESVDEALGEAERAVRACLEEWLLGNNPYLQGAASKRTTSPFISSRAMGVLIQELCVRDLLKGLGLINQSFEPYLAFFRPDDVEEVERQIEHLRDLLVRDGCARWADLPEPLKSRRGRAWRQLVLGHGEFLGLGWLADRWEIVAW